MTRPAHSSIPKWQLAYIVSLVRLHRMTASKRLALRFGVTRRYITKLFAEGDDEVPLGEALRYLTGSESQHGPVELQQAKPGPGRLTHREPAQRLQGATPLPRYGSGADSGA